MSVEQDESVHSSEGVEQNGDVSEDQGVEEVEVDESGLHKEPNLSNAITFGGLLRNGTGTTVDGYTAVNRGLNKFVQPKFFAMLLFSASEGKMPWITTTVPQKIMCNSVFVVDLKNLESENALFRDGLGSWIQNCGKVANFFTWEHDDVKHAFYLQEIKNMSTVTQGVEFVRRIDKNASCPAYTRVTVICAQLGLAALQYFFKGEDEQTFEISYHRPKKNAGSLILTSPASHTRSHKRKISAQEDEEDVSTPRVFASTASRSNGVVRSSLPLAISSPSASRATTHIAKDLADLSPSALLACLRDHIKCERDDRLEERKLRREEMEQRKRERLEDRQARKEDIELRKQEMTLQNTRIALDQQKWEIERKEKEILWELLKKKGLIDT